MNRDELMRQLEANKAEWESLKDRLMQEDHLDEDGYPTDAALELVEKWHWSDCPGLFEFMRSIWHMADWGWRETDASTLPEFDLDHDKTGQIIFCISTAGWSGNESIISAFQRNTMAWHLCWIQSRRGGHYRFKPYSFKDDE